MKKSAFFFLNHSAHIYHAVSIAFQLSTLENQNVKIFTSTKNNLQIIKELEKFYPEHTCSIIYLDVSWFYKITRSLKNRDFPGFNAIFKNNIKLIETCDTFVSPSDEILGLKKFKHLKNKFYITTLHGAGSLGYDFLTTLSQFDMVLLSGDKLKNIFDEYKNLNNSNVISEVIGYPKVELCKIAFQKKENIFNNNNKTVVYMPHFDAKYSSLKNWGLDIVSFFLEHNKYNLIVAPHILFSKSEKKRLQKLAKNKSNIFLDVDSKSRRLIDMSYLFEADIYIGDKSSQIYEFLMNPKPCLFLNSHGVDWENSSDENFDAWHLGDVVENINELNEKLSNAENNHKNYIAKQKLAVAERINQFEEGSSMRAAKILARF
jgi:CDP-glycerol glycerophosphotransferase (TagB/SpsB family)